MSNSKSDQTVTPSNLPVKPARKVTQGAKGHLQAKATFILKPKLF